jgi:hypothetical protein
MPQGVRLSGAVVMMVLLGLPNGKDDFQNAARYCWGTTSELLLLLVNIIGIVVDYCFAPDHHKTIHELVRVEILPRPRSNHFQIWTIAMKQFPPFQ